ncbi:MAG TPA: glycosyltransferase, partial [Actinomycetota bacterium]|nr:glycosyltransferase [Actinomycetota bacterium]
MSIAANSPEVGAPSTVSVVIACDRRARSIPGCLDSVLSQESVAIEVLLIDDGSNDWTSAIVAAAARTDARVRIVASGNGDGGTAGGTPTIADALASASGEYTMLLNVDDRLAPGALARAAGVLGLHPSVGMVYGGSLPFYSDDAMPGARTETAVPELWQGRDWIAERCRTASMGVASARAVVRTTLERELGDNRTALPPDEALARCLRLATRADIAFLRGVDQTYVVAAPNALARPGSASPIEDLRLRKATFDAWFAVDGQDLPGAQDLHAMAHRALAREALSVAGSGDGPGRNGGWIAELEVFASLAFAEARAFPRCRQGRWMRRARARLGRGGAPQGAGQ